MAILSINSNLAAAGTVRQIARNSSALASSFEKLSSGLRINRASDDAAGLAISSALRADSRVYGQAIRNANDAISALNIAGGAITQLSAIATRLKELATSSANGTYSLFQRRTIDSEAHALTDEFNRLINSTDFNGRRLLDGSLADLGIQLGYGTEQMLSFGVGNQLQRSVGTGYFTNGTDVTAGGNITDMESAQIEDIDGDGNNDLIIVSAAGLEVRRGNGDGTFQASSSLHANAVNGLSLGDLNGDGRQDIVSVGANNLYVSLNNGNGAFAAAVAYAKPNGAVADVALGDFNADGLLDMATTGNSGMASVFLNSGAGSFGARNDFAFSSPATTINSIYSGDLNGDGYADLVGTVNNNNQVAVILGGAGGAFGPAAYYSETNNPWTAALTDFNHDGVLDLATATYGTDSVNVRLGRGDGTFGNRTTYSGIGVDTAYLEAADMNGDGYQDLVSISTTDGSLHQMLGNGDGTFQSATTSTISGNVMIGIALGDINGDGVADAVSGRQGGTTLDVLIADTEQVTTIGRINLTTRAQALLSLEEIDAIFQKVQKEVGSLGGTESRLRSALSTLSSTRLNYEGAYSRIMDVDVAQESSQLAANAIRQQVSAAVLAQANISPQLALSLLTQQ